MNRPWKQQLNGLTEATWLIVGALVGIKVVPLVVMTAQAAGN